MDTGEHIQDETTVPPRGKRGPRVMEKRKEMKALEAYDPETFRKELDTPERRKRWLAQLDKGIDNNERHWVRMYAESMKLIGQQPQVMIAIYQELGVDSKDELARLVEYGQRVEGMSEREQMTLCEQALVEYYRKHPGAVAISPLAPVFEAMRIEPEV